MHKIVFAKWIQKNLSWPSWQKKSIRNTKLPNFLGFAVFSNESDGFAWFKAGKVLNSVDTTVASAELAVAFNVFAVQLFPHNELQSKLRVVLEYLFGNVGKAFFLWIVQIAMFSKRKKHKIMKTYLLYWHHIYIFKCYVAKSTFWEKFLLVYPMNLRFQVVQFVSCCYTQINVHCVYAKIEQMN